MKILALESSATACSAALWGEDGLIAQNFQNSGLTHSRTLMPMVDAMLRSSEMQLSDMDAIAVAIGPGSFTGVRIGVAAAKGLAWPGEKPCAPCSTLESMAWQVAHMEGEICAVMDARRNQVYAARFLGTGGSLVRISPDGAVDLENLAAEVKKSGNPQILVGDGAALCYNAFKACGIAVRLAPPHLLRQTAWGVARAGLELARKGQLVDAGQVKPQYHRLSQAERERLERMVRATEPNQER